MSPQEQKFVEAIAEALEPLTKRVGALEKTTYTIVGAVVFAAFCISTGIIKLGG